MFNHHKYLGTAFPYVECARRFKSPFAAMQHTTFPHGGIGISIMRFEAAHPAWFVGKEAAAGGGAGRPPPQGIIAT